MPLRPRINWFSPVPPARSSIASFSADLLPDLVARADVTVWTSQREAPESIAEAPVRRFDPTTPVTAFSGADANFYNIGNNLAFHEDIYRVSLAVAGVPILHDPVMPDFFRQLDRLGWRTAPRGWFAKAFTDVKAALHLEAIETEEPPPRAVAGARAVVVHRRGLVAPLAAKTGLPVFYIPLSHRLRQPPPQPRPPATPPYRLITFGYLGANRRLDVIARALMASQYRDVFVWDIFGEMENTPPETARALEQLGARVRVHGYVEEAALDAALRDADLALNLRNPTGGEASSSQLRIWEHGLPSLATRAGWYAEQPESAVTLIDPAREFAEVQAQLAAFVADPQAWRAQGLAGRAIFERDHRVDAYAQALVDIALRLRG